MDGRPKLGGDRWLTGGLDEHQDLGGAIGYALTMLVRDFLAKGGDLSQPAEIRFSEERPDPDSPPRLCARLHGWGMSRSSSSATTASSGS